MTNQMNITLESSLTLGSYNAPRLFLIVEDDLEQRNTIWGVVTGNTYVKRALQDQRLVVEAVASAGQASTTIAEYLIRSEQNGSLSLLLDYNMAKGSQGDRKPTDSLLVEPVVLDYLKRTHQNEQGIEQPIPTGIGFYTGFTSQVVQSPQVFNLPRKHPGVLLLIGQKSSCNLDGLVTFLVGVNNNNINQLRQLSADKKYNPDKISDYLRALSQVAKKT